MAGRDATFTIFKKIYSIQRIWKINHFTPDDAKSKIVNFLIIKTGHHSEVLLDGFSMNGHTSGVCTTNPTLHDFVSPEV